MTSVVTTETAAMTTTMSATAAADPTHPVRADAERVRMRGMSDLGVADTVIIGYFEKSDIVTNRLLVIF